MQANFDHLLSTVADQEAKPKSKTHKKGKRSSMDNSPFGERESSVISNNRKQTGIKKSGQANKRMNSYRSNNASTTKSTHCMHTLDGQFRDDISIISDITHKSRPCFRPCCIEK